jgi:hypothetical protein
MPKDRIQSVLLATLVVAGVPVRLWQYVGNPSMWIDEIAVAESIISRPLGTLLGQPLAFNQIAPPGFLALVKTTVALLGPTDFALRLFPLLCAVASLPLFAALASRTLDRWSAVFSMGLFAFGVPFILHGAEVKQYASDVTVSLILMNAALGLLGDAPPRKVFWHAGVLGAASVWFSQPAVILLAGLGAALAWTRIRASGWSALRRILPVLLLWAAAAAASIAWSLHLMSPATLAFAHDWWFRGGHGAKPVFLVELFEMPRMLLALFGWAGMRYRWPFVFVVLLIVGFGSLWMRKREIAILLLGPVAVVVAAAAAQEYPISERTSLFLIPLLLLAAAAGARAVADILARFHVPVPLSLALLALPPIAGFRANPPVYRREEARPVLAALAAHQQPRDGLFIYYIGRLAFSFYGPRVGLDVGGAILGGCHRGDLRAYLREVDGLRGKARAWVFFGHDVPALAEQATIRAYLGRIGSRRGGFSAPDSLVELYDLSDPERLASASAETFPVPPVDPQHVAWLRCDVGPLGPGDEATISSQSGRQ